MEAVFINDFPAKSNSSPVEVVNAFLASFSANGIGGKLFEVYRLAVLGGLGEGGAPVSAEEVASLFDQLIAFVHSVEILRTGGGGASLLVFKKKEEVADV